MKAEAVEGVQVAQFNNIERGVDEQNNIQMK